MRRAGHVRIVAQAYTAEQDWGSGILVGRNIATHHLPLCHRVDDTANDIPPDVLNSFAKPISAVASLRKHPVCIAAGNLTEEALP